MGSSVRLIILALSFVLINGMNGNEVDWEATGQEILTSILGREKNENIAKNVILFLGDGMGISTVTASRIYKGQLANRTGEETDLAFDKFPHVALAKTYCVDKQVTGSAASATAFLCGVKTVGGVVGLNQRARRADCSSERGNEVTSILDWSHDAGKSTGIVTTTTVTHGTPAAGYANSVERNWETDSDMPESARGTCHDIALQLIRDNGHIQVIFGGGREFFYPKHHSDPEYPDENGTRSDGRNLIEEWKQARISEGQSHAFFWNQSGFDSADPSNTDFMMGLFEASHMHFEIDRDADKAGEPSIAEMTEKAINVLKRNDKGFFLLVEGGRIDHAHHGSLPKRAMVDTLAFEEAIERALELTDTDDTLIVVTADHSHSFVIGGYPERGNPILGLRTYDSRDKYNIPPTDGMPDLTLGYIDGRGPARYNLTGMDTYGKNFMFPSAIPKWITSHAGEDVSIYAKGPMSHLFDGVVEQHYVAHAMAYASCVGINHNHCLKRPPSDCDTSGAVQVTAPLIMVIILLLFSHLKG